MPEPCKCRTCKKFWNCPYIDGFVKAKDHIDRLFLRQLLEECVEYVD